MNQRLHSIELKEDAQLGLVLVLGDMITGEKYTMAFIPKPQPGSEIDLKSGRLLIDFLQSSRAAMEISKIIEKEH